MAALESAAERWAHAQWAPAWGLSAPSRALPVSSDSRECSSLAASRTRRAPPGRDRPWCVRHANLVTLGKCRRKHRWTDFLVFWGSPSPLPASRVRCVPCRPAAALACARRAARARAQTSRVTRPRARPPPAHSPSRSSTCLNLDLDRSMQTPLRSVCLLAALLYAPIRQRRQRGLPFCVFADRACAPCGALQVYLDGENNW